MQINDESHGLLRCQWWMIDSMNWIHNLRLSFSWTVRCIEWLVLLSCLLSGLISSYFQDKPGLMPVFIAYNLIFLAFSFVFPAKQPLWQRRTYIAAEMALLVSAVWMRLWFTLLMYFVLLKSCLFLKRTDVILIATLTGVGYLSGDAWYVPQRIAETVARIQTQGVSAAYNPLTMVLGALIDYIAVCLFIIWFGFVLVAERQSRQRAEVLAKEVEILAASLERTRIARDIHDSLGHSLTTLNVQLELAQKLHKREPSQVVQALDAAQTLAMQCLQDVRRSLQPLHQPEFDLKEGLMVLVEQVKQSQSFQVLVDLQLPPLPLATSHQLYCIVKEGLTNIQRHAQADLVTLKGYYTSESICLELGDNGKGFDRERPHIGFGLRGMEERVQILGGQIKIASRIGEGTQIQVVILR